MTTTEFIVTLALSTLPLDEDGKLDRAKLAEAANCPPSHAIMTVVAAPQRYEVIVRCLATPIPGRVIIGP